MLCVMLRLWCGMQSFIHEGVDGQDRASTVRRIRTSPWRLTPRVTRAQFRGVHRVTEARAQEAKILTTRTDHQSKYDPMHEEFWEKVRLPGDAENSSVCRGTDIEPLHAKEDPCKQGGLTTRTGQR